MGGKMGFPCHICEMKFTIANSLKTHLEKAHRTLNCAHCPATFNERCKLKEHMTADHREFTLKLCTICGAKLAKNKDLKRHIEAIHQGLKPFACHLCDSKFSEKHLVKRHIDTVHERNHICVQHMVLDLELGRI